MSNPSLLVSSKKDFESVTFKQEQKPEDDFHGLTFSDCSFEHCDFSNSIFSACTFDECHFKDCNLSLVQFNQCRFRDTAFETCKMIGIDWNKIQWPNILVQSPIKFFHCILNDSSFFSLYLPELVMQHCKAHDVDFREGDFHEGDFSYTDFTGSLFGKTILRSTDFREAINYGIDVFENEVKHAKFSRDEALNLLQALEIELD